VLDGGTRRFAAPDGRRERLRMELDVRDGARADALVVAEPADEDIARALGSLDQRRHTEMALVDEDGGYVVVGGGRGRYHVCTGAVLHGDGAVLQSPDAGGTDNQEELVVGGRRRRYATREVVDLGLAAAAVSAFLRGGRPHTGLSWRAA
jgi:Immunity protein Imm1